MQKYNWIFLNIILLVLFILVLFPLPGICSSVGNKIFLKEGGNLNGTSINPSNPTLTVNRGESITGILKVQAIYSGPSNNVVPFGYTSSWGFHSSSYVTVKSDLPVGTLIYNISINLNAPRISGIYYLIFASRPEMNLGWIMSQTNWTTGNKHWNDGKDIANLTESKLQSSISTGYLYLDMLERSTYKTTTYGIAYIKLIVIDAKIQNSGTIKLISNPSGASVFLDNSFKGVSPITLKDITIGKHIIKIIKTGYKVVEEEATVSSNKTTEILVNLTSLAISNGKIKVTSNPSSAKVFLDVGKYIGKTPLIIGEILPGKHKVTLELDNGKKSEAEVDVIAGKVIDLSFTFPGKIKVTSVPSLTKVFLDEGRYMGKTPLTINGILPGKHKVTLVLTNYEKYAQEVEVIADKVINVSAVLVSTSVKPKPPLVGKLVLNSTPSYAQVYLNGIYKGITITPLAIDKLSYGTYNLKLTKAGYEDWAKEIIIYSDKTTEIHAELKPESGSIYISSSPSGATIYLDGIYKSTTTKTIDNIPSGSHTIKITKTGYEDVTRDIKVIAGKTTTLSVDLERILATIEVFSTPSGAKIYLDNIYKGTTPLTLDKLGFGSNHLKLTKAGYQDWTKDIVVSSAKTIEVHAELKPEPGSISISSSPSGATIYLDGKEKGHTPNTINDISLGSHTIKITRTGCEDVTKYVKVTTGKTTSVSVDLAPIFATIEVSSIPYGAQVYLDDAYKGTTPLTINQVTFGKHQIKVTKAFYLTQTIDIDITSSEPQSFEVSLLSVYPFFLLALILPALAIIYYLFILPIKRKKKKERKEGEKETIEDLPPIQKEDSQEEIREQLPDEPISDDPITWEYREIQEKMEEQANIRTLLSQTKEKIKKAISLAQLNNKTFQLSSLQAISSDLDTLSQQFEYGKLSCEDTQKELLKITERLKNIN